MTKIEYEALEKYQEYIEDKDVEDIIERWEILYNRNEVKV